MSDTKLRKLIVASAALGSERAIGHGIHQRPVKRQPCGTFGRSLRVRKSGAEQASGAEGAFVAPTLDD